jgi:hypothetical protein
MKKWFSFNLTFIMSTPQDVYVWQALMDVELQIVDILNETKKYIKETSVCDCEKSKDVKKKFATSLPSIIKQLQKIKWEVERQDPKHTEMLNRLQEISSHLDGLSFDCFLEDLVGDCEIPWENKKPLGPNPWYQ